MPRDKLPLNHSYRSSSPRRSILSVLPKRRSARALILLALVSIIGFFVVRYDPERFSPVIYQLYEHKWLSSFNPRLGSFDSAPKPAPHPPQVHTSEPDKGPEGATLRELVSESIALEKERFLKEIQYDKDYETRHMHAPVTSTLDPSLEAYVNRLRRFVRDYLRESPHRPHLDLMLDRLGQHIAPPLYKDEPIPKVVLSTHKDLKGLPDFFQNWEKRLKPEGWEVKVADDDVMQTWFDAWSEGSDGLKRIWDMFPRPVLKTDFLRYVAMLLNGGIYTDSDTQPRSHPYLWGTDAEPLVPQVLQPLLKLSNLTAPPLPGIPRVPKHIPNPNSDFLSYADAYEGGINDPEVSLVASVEFDAWIRDFPEDWKWGYVRSMQVVQWTIMAKPYHPILLDTLEIVVRNVERAEKKGTFDGSIGALEMTGPGPFTDAIYRYFIAMYGVPPKPFERRTRSSRVGDVILLPEWSFAQPGPQPDEWDWKGPEPQTRCVSHAFMGRWKDDGWGPYD